MFLLAGLFLIASSNGGNAIALDLPLSVYHRNQETSFVLSGKITIIRHDRDGTLLQDLECSGEYSAYIPFIQLPNRDLFVSMKINDCHDRNTGERDWGYPNFIGDIVVKELEALENQHEMVCKESSFFGSKVCVHGNKVVSTPLSGSSYSKVLDYSDMTNEISYTYLEENYSGAREIKGIFSVRF